MAKLTNNEKILHILNTQDAMNPLLNDYLVQLKKRSDWQQCHKKNYLKIVAELNQLKSQESKKQIQQKNIVHLFNKAKSEASIIIMYNSEIRFVHFEIFYQFIQLSEVNQQTVQLMILLKSKLSKESLLAAMLEKLIALCFAMSKKDYHQFLYYSQFFTKGIRFYQTLSQKQLVVYLGKILSLCQKSHLDTYKLNELIMMVINEKEYPEKPNPEILLAMLHKMRMPKMYIKRGYTVLNYYQPLIYAMNNLRRVLRESREYTSFYHAVINYNNAVNNLRNYYHTNYLQVGGMPKNTKATIDK